MKSTIGIIGCGVVGSAVNEYFQHCGHPTVVYDKYKEIGSVLDVVRDSDLIFVSVPTPTHRGEQDLSALLDVLSLLSTLGYTRPVVIKSTVLPGTCDRLQDHYKTLSLVHNPEFLTEKNAAKDFALQRSIVLSGRNRDAVFSVFKVYCKAFPDSVVLDYPDFKISEMGKYIHNTFLATKVAYMNEIYQVCQALGTDYSQAVESAICQGAIGTTHIRVPGPDGQLGFGGMCFVKDTEALLKDHPEKLTILKAAVESNKTIRPSAYDGTENVGNT